MHRDIYSNSEKIINPKCPTTICHDPPLMITEEYYEAFCILTPQQLNFYSQE